MYYVIILLCIAVTVYFTNKHIKKIRKQYIDEYNKLLHQKKSSEVKLGHTVENMAPILNDWPHDTENCKFLGMPIDFIIFNEDSIVFVEVKSGNARLSKNQQNVKRLVKEGKVYFEVFRINEKGIKLKRDNNEATNEG